MNCEQPTEDFGFRFALGDLVEHVGAAPCNAESLVINWGHDQRVKLVIIDRILEQCHGGVQRHYTVRAVTAHGNFGQPFRCSEPELRPTTTHAEDAAAIKAAEEARKK